MVTVTRPGASTVTSYSLGGLQSKIHEAKMAIDDELGRATDMDFRLKLVITANSLRNLEEQIMRRS
jgi:hypothetical protein